MEFTTDTQSANFSDALATWNIPRSVAELRSFVATREEAIDVEDFDFE